MVALLVAGGTSFVLTLLLTPFLIRLLRRSGVGQPIHDDMHHHTQKAGTPTMGGAVVPLTLVTVIFVQIVATLALIDRLAAHQAAGTSMGGMALRSPRGSEA